MKRLLAALAVSGLLAGCSQPPSDFELACGALSKRDTNALAAILARNKGVVTNVSGFDDATLLHYSLSNVPDIPCSELLVQAGANINQRDRTGATPLHIACKHGTLPEAIRFLVKYKADVNAPDGSGTTPLQIATRPGHGTSPEGVALLKAAGAKE